MTARKLSLDIGQKQGCRISSENIRVPLAAERGIPGMPEQAIADAHDFLVDQRAVGSFLGSASRCQTSSRAIAMRESIMALGGENFGGGRSKPTGPTIRRVVETDASTSFRAEPRPRPSRRQRSDGLGKGLGG